MSQVEFKLVSKAFASQIVVDQLNLIIPKGQFVSLLGPSGCGKTTSLRMIAGLEQNTSGSILFDGEYVSDVSKKINMAPEKRNVGMVFQSYAVWPHMNVFENIAYPLKLQKIEKSEIQKRVQEILEIVELNGLGERRANELSGGQQQRVALARGLVMKPRILLLDEPLSNLDAKLREKMRKDIREIQKRFQLTMVYVTHDQREAFQMSDKIVVMNKGRIEQEGTPPEIRSKPANAFVEDFIRSGD